MDQTVFVFRDGRADPRLVVDSVDDALWHVRMAERLTDLDVEELSIVVFDDETGDPLYRLPICSLNAGEVYDLNEFRRRRLEDYGDPEDN